MNKKGVENTISKQINLSENQKEFLKLILHEGLTPKQISERRQISKAAVYKTIAKLRKKGALSKYQMGGLKKNRIAQTIQPPSFKKGKQIRLHRQEFNIKLLYIPDSYHKLRQSKGTFYFKGNTIRFYRSSIEVYASPDLHFWGTTVQEATSRSVAYWNDFFKQLENRYSFIIIKGPNTRIKQVNAHYSEINNELAEQELKHNNKIQIRATEDNKVWFTIDNSFNLKEAEFQHSETSKQDAEKLTQHFNEIRDHDLLSPLEIHKSIQDLSKGINAQGEMLKRVILTIDKLNTKVEEMSK